MDIPVYQIDAFTNSAFSGNPAAVCPLESWLDEAVMQSIAAENNLAETAFCVRLDDGKYALRWFTPTVEVELCGHATLATAWVLWNKCGETVESISFETLSGRLTATRVGQQIELDFPARPSEPCEVDPQLERALGIGIVGCYSGANRIAVLESEAAVRDLQPDFSQLAKLNYGVIVTALAEAGDDSRNIDFVSRYFAVPFGIDEDPVTGSAHCDLMPYWVERLGRFSLMARQLSARGGEIGCELRGERVLLRGDAVCVLSGKLHLPQ